jgi:hypothetical protein
MTDFEKFIEPKRGMTREKFEEILKREYGGYGYIYKYTYGDVASWFAWNRDENDKNKINILPEDKSQEKNNIYDGDIYNWDKEKLSIITTDIVFIGLNMSADGKPLYEDSPEDFWFQNARRYEKIVHTFFNTKAEGAYFTDILKPDKRLPNKKGKSSDSSEVMKIIKSQTGNEIVKDHLHLFKKELGDIGAKKPLLIVFGGGAEWIINQGIKNGILKESDFYAKVKIIHYTYRFRGFNDIKKYRNDTRERLKDYITIPEKKFPINL